MKFQALNSKIYLKAVMEIRVFLARILRIPDPGSLGQGSAGSGSYGSGSGSLKNIYNINKNLC